MKHLSTLSIVSALALVPSAHALTFDAVVVSSSSSTAARQVSSSSVQRATSSTLSVTTTQSSSEQKGNADVFMEYEGIPGESKTPSIDPDEIDAQDDDRDEDSAESRSVSSTASLRPASSDAQEGKAFMKIGDIEGDSPKAPGVEPDEIDSKAMMKSSVSSKKKASLDVQWKVEEGEKATVASSSSRSIAAPESDPEPVMPDFGILLGGGDEADDADDDRRSAVAALILEGLEDGDRPMETLSLNFEKIQVHTRQEVYVFGFIPVHVLAAVDVDATGKTTVDYPWWSFLASGKDSDALGKDVVRTLGDVLERKRDAIRSAFGK